MTQHIRLLSPFFDPEPISTGRYNTHLARALVERGHSVEVHCSHPIYPDWRPRRATGAPAGVTVHRGGGWMRYPRSPLLRRLVLECWFAGHCLRAKTRRDEILVSVLPPDLGPWLAMLIGKRFEQVAIVHDLQGIMARSVDTVLRRAIARLVHGLERRTLLACDRIVCLSEAMREVLVRDYGLEATRCMVCYPFVTMPRRPSSHDDLAPLFPPDRRHVVYAGALGEKQRPHDLLALFRTLCHHDQSVTCHVFSNGPAMAGFRREVERDGLSGIQCHDLVPDDQLPHLYAHSALQIIPQAKGTGSGAFPSKLPNLMAAGVPVLALCDADSELARVLTESGGGLVASGEGVNDWVDQALALLEEAGRENHDARRSRLAPFIERRFSVDRVIEAIAGGTRER